MCFPVFKDAKKSWLRLCFQSAIEWVQAFAGMGNGFKESSRANSPNVSTNQKLNCQHFSFQSSKDYSRFSPIDQEKDPLSPTFNRQCLTHQSDPSSRIPLILSLTSLIVMFDCVSVKVGSFFNISWKNILLIFIAGCCYGSIATAAVNNRQPDIAFIASDGATIELFTSSSTSADMANPPTISSVSIFRNGSINSVSQSDIAGMLQAIQGRHLFNRSLPSFPFYDQNWQAFRPTCTLLEVACGVATIGFSQAKRSLIYQSIIQDAIGGKNTTSRIESRNIKMDESGVITDIIAPAIPYSVYVRLMTLYDALPSSLKSSIGIKSNRLSVSELIWRITQGTTGYNDVSNALVELQPATRTALIDFIVTNGAKILISPEYLVPIESVLSFIITKGVRLNVIRSAYTYITTQQNPLYDPAIQDAINAIAIDLPNQAGTSFTNLAQSILNTTGFTSYANAFLFLLGLPADDLARQLVVKFIDQPAVVKSVNKAAGVGAFSAITAGISGAISAWDFFSNTAIDPWRRTFLIANMIGFFNYQTTNPDIIGYAYNSTTGPIPYSIIANDIKIQLDYLAADVGVQYYNQILSMVEPKWGSTMKAVGQDVFSLGVAALSSIPTGGVSLGLIPYFIMNSSMQLTSSITKQAIQWGQSTDIQSAKTDLEGFDSTSVNIALTSSAWGQLLQDAIVVIPPVITLNGGDITITQGQVYTDPGATAFDNIDLDITAQIITTGTVDVYTTGQYQVTYNVSDSAGNPAVQMTRMVHVLNVGQSQPPISTGFTDNFATLDLTRWEKVSGTWSAANGQLTGFWSQSAAQTDQGNLLLAPTVLAQGADFSAQFKFTITTGSGHKFSLYNTLGNKYDIFFGPSRFGVELRQNSGNYTLAVPYTTYASQGLNVDCSLQTCTAQLDKVGNQYTIKLNGSTIGMFTDTIWNGNTRLGLGAYGTTKYDSFTLNAPSINITNGLVAYYPFDGNANDASGNGNHATIVGAATFVAGSTDQAIYINNPSGGATITQYVALPNAPSFISLNQSSFTVNICYKTTDSTEANGRLFGNMGPFLTDGIFMDYNGGGNVGAFSEIQSGSVVTGVALNSGANLLSVVTDGTMHCEALILDRINNQLLQYMDGTLIESVPVVGLGAVPMTGLVLGASKVGDTYGARLMTVDDLRIYNRALSAAEIAQLAAISAAPVVDLYTGLVAYYPFDGNANDVSGNGNNGTATSVNYTQGVTGQAGIFNGTDSVVDVAGNTMLNMSKSISISAWVKVATVNSVETMMIVNKESSYEMGISGTNKNNNIPSNHVMYYLAKNGLPNNGGGWTDGKKIVNTGSWRHVALTDDGSRVTSYVNGVVTSTYPVTGQIPNSSGNLRIGGRSITPAFFSGLIDEVRIYNRALSAAEITQLATFASTNQPPVPTAPAITTPFATTGTSQITANDPNAADTHTYVVSTAATHGVATVDAYGLATYTPNAGSSGADSFTISVTDSGGLSGLVTVNVVISTSAGGTTLRTYNLNNNLTPPDMTFITVLPNVAFSGGKLVANTTDAKGYLETNYSVAGSNKIRAKAKATLAYSYWGMAGGIEFVDVYGNNVLTTYVATSVSPNKPQHFDASGGGSFTLPALGAYSIELIADANQVVANIYDANSQLLTTLNPTYLAGKSFSDINKIRFMVYATTDNNAMIDDLLVDTGSVGVNNGLIAHYPLDGDTLDASGNGRNGTATGNPVYVAGVHGQALSFDGVNDEINLGTWAIPSSGSVALWVKHDGVKNNPSSWAQGVFGKWSGTDICNQYPFTIILSDATKSINGSVNPACAAVSVKTGTLIANQWYHVTFTWSAAAVNMFVDGILVNSAAGKLSTSGSEPVTVGRWHNALNGWGWYAGKIDDLRIYNRVLSAAEIQTLAGKTMTAITAQHALQSGWNLIGWSVEDTSYSTPANFAQLVAAHGGQVRSIWNYVGGNSNLWQNWNGLSIAASDPNFTALIAGKGYWVKMAPMAPGSSVMVTLKGVPAPAISALQPGWSVVAGSPNIRDVTALSGLVTQWGGLSAWSMQYGVWQSFIAGAPTFLNSMQSMSSEQGYYIFK